jgi:hypothetical protein
LAGFGEAGGEHGEDGADDRCGECGGDRTVVADGVDELAGESAFAGACEVDPELTRAR